MNVFKAVAGVSLSIIITLLILTTLIKNPEKVLYEKTIEVLMVHKGLATSREVMSCYPEVRDIESKRKRIAFLNRSIRNATEGPSPNISREKSLQIQELYQEIRQLRSSVKKELTQLIAIHTKN